MATLDTEIRKLQPIELCTLGQILNHSDSWKKLMAIVPQNGNESSLMFNNEHFTMIEQAIRQQQRSGADIFLSEWSTLSKRRPTCRLMLDLLVKAELFRAADYLAVNILKRDPPERPKFGPAAAVDVSEKALEELLKQQVDDLGTEFELSEECSMSWSVHFVEKPIDAIAGYAEKTKEHDNQSDLMKFSSNKSDMMKFSKSEDEVLGNLPEQMTDLMKFSNENVEKVEVVNDDNYVLQEARSEDIPLCVRENLYQSSRIISSVTENSESATSIDSTDVSQTTIPSEQTSLPNISQNVIPVVVLEYNEKDKSKTDM